MLNEKLVHRDHCAEMALIGWMAATSEFISVPEEYIHNKEIKDIYNYWKEQYLENGSFIFTMVPEGTEVVLSECMEVATTASSKPIITNLRKANMVRKACEFSLKILQGLDQERDVVKILNWAGSNITNLLTDHYNEKDYNHVESLVEFLVDLDQNRKGKNKFKGIESHIPTLDNTISGWQRGKVYLISGLEKMGKSRLVRNLFSTWLNKGYGCLMFLLEEDESSVHECIIGSRAKVDTFKFNTNMINDDMYARISYETNIYKEQPLYISIKSAITPQYVKSIIQKKKIEFAKIGCDVVFVAIDYIQRMSNEGNSKHEETENIASQLADIARDENVCLIEVSQMVSGAEKQKGLPLHTQIRFGKVFKEAANTIITLDDPTRGEPKEDSNEGDVKPIYAHIIQRKGKSNVYDTLIAELRYSQFNSETK